MHLLESLFNKVAVLKRLQHRCFSVNFAKFLRTHLVAASDVTSAIDRAYFHSKHFLGVWDNCLI